MLANKKKLISAEEYLETEKIAKYKSEYYRGETFAMSGASHNHNVIAVNIMASLHDSLRNSDCFVYTSDMKTEIEKDEYYVYPDVSIVCGDIEFADNRDDIVTNPVVIFEILSKSTKNYDKGPKFRAYQGIPSLRDYILIDQYACHVEYFFKNKAGKWELDEFKNRNDVFKIRSVDAELSLEAIYHRIHPLPLPLNP